MSIRFCASLKTTPDFATAHRAWSDSRADFNSKLAAHEPSAVAERWQRNYLRGESPLGEKALFHVTKRKLKGASEGETTRSAIRKTTTNSAVHQHRAVDTVRGVTVDRAGVEASLGRLGVVVEVGAHDETRVTPQNNRQQR